MNAARLVLLFLGITFVAACSGPESTGIPNVGGRRSYGSGGSAGDSAGTLDTTGTGGDPAENGGGNGGTGGGDFGDAQASGPGDAPSSELGDVTEAGEGAASGRGDAGTSDGVVGDSTSDARDGSVDAPADVDTQDVVTTAQCSATPSQDFQCGSPRPPHRYVCPLSVGTPTGCQRISTGSTSAAYCCP
jgi:hypothetical protein